MAFNSGFPSSSFSLLFLFFFDFPRIHLCAFVIFGDLLFKRPVFFPLFHVISSFTSCRLPSYLIFAVFRLLLDHRPFLFFFCLDPLQRNQETHFALRAVFSGPSIFELLLTLLIICNNSTASFPPLDNLFLAWLATRTSLCPLSFYSIPFPSYTYSRPTLNNPTPVTYENT